MTNEKLPEWPEEPVAYSRTAALDYHTDLAEAALARMEALVEVVREYRDQIWSEQCEMEKLKPIDALLSACERGKEAGK